MRKLVCRPVVCSLLFVVCAAWGQGTTSRVVGVVSDATGAVVPKAKVTLTNEATRVSFTTTTTATGTYVFDAVQVGGYSLTVEAQGFKKFVAPGNRVTIGQPATVNVTLEVGAVVETVEVSGAAEIVQTSASGNFGSLVEQRVLQDLPIVGTRGRNPLQLVLTQPGVVSGSNTGGGVHVHGARDRAWNFTLDGIDTNETSAGGSNFSPLRTNPDSLAEFQVITSNPTAEYGRNSGAQVAMITRSGSNEFHGNVFWFYRTPRFNANEWENNLDRVGKRQFVQHIPGFSAGGPIIKNRTFFFVNTQWLRALQTGTFTRTVYTSDARRGIWRYVRGGRNFPAGVAGASVDASGNPLPGLSIGSYNVPGSDPERLGLDPSTQAAISMTPLPNNFSAAGGDGLNRAGFTYVAPEREKQYDLVFKIDHVFNDRNFLFARVAWGRQDTRCDQVNGGEPRFPGLPCIVNTERSPRNLAFNWRWNPTPRITNELVVGGNHFTFNFVIPTADANKATFTGTPVTMPEDFEFGNLRTLNTYQVVENFTYVHGAHTFKMGANLRYQQHVDTRGSIAGQNASPLVNFSTSVNTVSPSAFNLPSDINQTFDRPALESSINFLLGRVGNITQGFVAQGDQYAPGGTLFNFDARHPEYDFYWQDNWKVRRNLTVDLGLRWELKLSPRDPENRIRRPNQPVTVGAPPSNTLRWETSSLHDNDLNNLGPSIGVAWDPTGSGKNSIRVNYRLAYDRINTFLLSSSVFQSIPGITLGVVNTDFGQPGGRLRNLPKIAPASSVKPSDFLQPTALSLNSITVMDRDFRAPKTNMWGFSYQRQLWGRTILETSYIGRRGVGLYGAYDVNQALFRNNGFLDAFNIVKSGGESELMNRLLAPDTRRQTGESGSQMVRRLFPSDLNLNNVASLAKSINNRIQGGRSIPDLAGLGAFFFIPYPQFSGAMRVVDSNDYSTYHALELKLERRFARGVSYMVGYTFAKSLDTRSFDPAFTVIGTGNAQSGSSTPFDIYNRKLNYARSDFDRTHAVQATWLYELPFGRGRRIGGNANGVVDRIISGWELAGFLRMTSGRPLTVFAGANTFSNVNQTPGGCNGCQRTDGEVFDDPATGFKWYFDPALRGKFSTPGPGEFGNTGRDFFTGPGFFSMDLGILKRTRIRENHYLEYRAEFTNFTNTPSFGFPTATITSTTFGRIRDSVVSGSRKIQMGLKYSF